MTAWGLRPQEDFFSFFFFQLFLLPQEPGPFYSWGVFVHYYTVYSITQPTTRCYGFLLREQGLALGAYDIPHPQGIEPTTLESYPSALLLPVLASIGSGISAWFIL